MKAAVTVIKIQNVWVVSIATYVVWLSDLWKSSQIQIWALNLKRYLSVSNLYVNIHNSNKICALAKSGIDCRIGWNVTFFLSLQNSVAIVI